MIDTVISHFFERNAYDNHEKTQCPPRVGVAFDLFSFDAAVKMFKCIFPECVVVVMAI